MVLSKELLLSSVFWLSALLKVKHACIIYFGYPSVTVLLFQKRHRHAQKAETSKSSGQALFSAAAELAFILSSDLDTALFLSLISSGNIKLMTILLACFLSHKAGN